MKKTGFLFLPFAAILFTACTQHVTKGTQPEVAKDTLAYSYQEVKEVKTPKSVYADIKYPLFKSDALNHELTSGIQRLFNFEPVSDSLKTFATQFLAGYNKTKISPYKLDISAKVMRQDSNLITLQINGSDTSNRKQASTKFFNWNTKSKKVITLDDILNPGYKAELNIVAEKIFRKEENLKDTSSLARDYFFKAAKFALNDNFLITPTGIRFLYNIGEIKPAAADTTDLYIPYSQITTLLKTNTVLAQYIKH